MPSAQSTRAFSPGTGGTARGDHEPQAALTVAVLRQEPVERGLDARVHRDTGLLDEQSQDAGV
jgi:hypothetical protein